MLHIETKFIKSGFCFGCWDKFIKENLGCDEPKFTEFAQSLAKNQVFYRNLTISCRLGRVSSLSLAMPMFASAIKKFLKVTRNAPATKLLVVKKPRIYP